MNNFVKRTLSATVYAALVISSILVHPYYFGVVFLVLSLLTVREFMHLMHCSVSQTICSLVLAAVLFAAYYCNGGLTTILSRAIYAGVLMLALVLELFLKAENPIHNWGYTLVSQIMIALPFALMTQLYGMGGIEQGKYILLALFILIWVNDSGAYIVGSLMSKRKGGNHKMFPRVSPNKSWEGLIGGAFFAILGGWVLYMVEWLPNNILFALVFALVISIFGTLGDLMESLMKRTIGVKDSGNIMPGHGGALDRFDSLLLATPAICLLFLCWPL
ncbi:MAG: phosphatidate cytidylyltransferase [Bacteroidales bacterium]|nr:phosphatidate cytidylyltransferase [Candidatus Colicola caccequi]